MDLRKVPGCHVYGGATPLAAGIAKIPKERNLIFNIDSETEDALKEYISNLSLLTGKYFYWQGDYTW